MSPARIAIVDDDPAFSQYLSTLLEGRGYQVQTFVSGSDLLRALGRPPVPDVVLLDVLMPGMDGLETLRAVRTAHPGLQVIMLSGTQVPATIVDAVRLGAVDYVVKPDDPEGLGEAALEAAIRNAVEKVTLTSEVARLRAQVADDPDGAQPCWGSGSSMRSVLTMVERVADSDVSVLISGESGVGKEVIARELHRRSTRRTHNFVKVNCAALPAELLESELFGHEKGAFTGATGQRAGAFELAHGGTIFLDEVGELPLDLQPKLLRVLETRTFRRVGGNKELRVDIRVLSASKRNLRLEVERGKFREDLYFRLSVVALELPSLRERREDIPQVARHLLARLDDGPSRGLPALSLSNEALEALMSHDWPGNVRELRNVIERAVYLSRASGREELALATLPGGSRGNAKGAVPISEESFEPGLSYRDQRARFEETFEKAYVSWLLERHDGNISAAAREADMDRKYLYKLAKKHGLKD